MIEIDCTYPSGIIAHSFSLIIDFILIYHLSSINQDNWYHFFLSIISECYYLFWLKFLAIVSVATINIILYFGLCSFELIILKLNKGIISSVI